jgi:ubiquinone/menaquinone biosynthesis C-methylase UbiE
MNLKELQKNWDQFGKTDPLWSILTTPDKKGNKWEINDFFDTGRKEIDSVMNYVESLDIKVQNKKALDFGCGVGRLTQALSYYFDEVYGVDVAPTMIELAKRYNRNEDTCHYLLNGADNLSIFTDSTFNFIYSTLTLQHMKPYYSRKYIKEFLRILVPSGLLIFQQASRGKPVSEENKFRINIRKVIRYLVPSIWIDLYRNKIQARNPGKPRMEMYELRPKTICRIVEESGGKILDVRKREYVESNWTSFQYCVTK